MGAAAAETVAHFHPFWEYVWPPGGAADQSPLLPSGQAGQDPGAACLWNPLVCALPCATQVWSQAPTCPSILGRTSHTWKTGDLDSSLFQIQNGNPRWQRPSSSLVCLPAQCLPESLGETTVQGNCEGCRRLSPAGWVCREITTT